MKICEVAINYIQFSILLAGFIQHKHKYDHGTVVTYKTTDNSFFFFFLAFKDKHLTFQL